MYHRIEHITKDDQGYIYWKGQYVEHFSYHWDELEKEIEECRLVADRCEKLERWNFPVGVSTVVWMWSWFEDWETLSEEQREEYHHFFAARKDWYENARGDVAFILIDDVKTRTCAYAVWEKSKQEFITHRAEMPPGYTAYHVLIKRGYKTADMEQGEKKGTVYATTSGVVGFIKRVGLEADFFNKLKDFERKSAS